MIHVMLEIAWAEHGLFTDGKYRIKNFNKGKLERKTMPVFSLFKTYPNTISVVLISLIISSFLCSKAFAQEGDHSTANHDKPNTAVDQESATDTPLAVIRITVDLGKDIGQPFGSLFEAVDPNGKSIIGAGFVSAYNSYYRADRMTLHLYVRPSDNSDGVQRAEFPRPSLFVHHYLFEAAGNLYATQRSREQRVYVWKPNQNSWEETNPAQQPVTVVAGKRLEFFQNKIFREGEEVFAFDPGVGSAGLFYYAQGWLFFHVAKANDPDHKTFLYACPWDTEEQQGPQIENAVVLPLTVPREFPYSYGQLDNAVFIGTNNGAVYRFKERVFHTLREASPNVSFQLYAMINYRNRLLMGQYPTGELFEIVGDEIVQLAGSPPRPANASGTAREAQTLALYRGDLFVGVWPWGEVWRWHDTDSTWEFIGRLFENPPLSPEITAPYEQEMNQQNEAVNNLWGQRVTSLIPYKDILIASTSNKNGTPYDESRFPFLAQGRWEEYGKLHRLYLPGNLAAPIQWSGKPIAFEVQLTDNTLRLIQDGRLIGTTRIPKDSATQSKLGDIRWGQGVFGPFSGKIIETSWSRQSQ